MSAVNTQNFSEMPCGTGCAAAAPCVTSCPAAVFAPRVYTVASSCACPTDYGYPAFVSPPYWRPSVLNATAYPGIVWTPPVGQVLGGGWGFRGFY